MSEREREQLKVLHEVEQGHLTQRQGAERLRMSERGFGKLLKRFRERGDSGVAHGLPAAFHHFWRPGRLIDVLSISVDTLSPVDPACFILISRQSEYSVAYHRIEVVCP